MEYSSLYEKEQFIYAKECTVLNGEKELQDVLLSPSIVIDLTISVNYFYLEKYLKTCWINTQQAFYEKSIVKKEKAKYY